MPATYEPIATTTLGSAATTITFSSITGTYTDLRLVIVARTAAGTDALRLRFNGDTATNYSWTTLQGNGTSASSVRQSSQNNIEIYSNVITTTPELFIVDIFSYAGSTNKTSLIETSEDTNGSGVVSRKVALWRSTSAITSMDIYSGTNNLGTGTTATLYGILKA